jgi:hypothetical protein
MMLRRVCVFCGSSLGVQAVYARTAQDLGKLLARRGLELVYGGSNVGLMGALADACLTHGGRVIGVIPKALAKKEVAHKGLTELHVVDSMHERKALMADFADAFIALPGGYGTWDEFCEVLTWSQLNSTGTVLTHSIPVSATIFSTTYKKFHHTASHIWNSGDPAAIILGSQSRHAG